MRGMFISFCLMIILGGLSSSLPRVLGKKLTGPNTQVASIARQLAERYDAPELANAKSMGEIREKIAGQYEGFTPEEKAFFDNACPQMEIITNPLAAKMLAMGTGGETAPEQPTDTAPPERAMQPAAKKTAPKRSSTGSENFIRLNDVAPAAPETQSPPPGEWQRRMNTLLLMARVNHADKIEAAAKYLWAIPIALISFGFLSRLVHCYGCARMAGSVVYSLSAWYLILLSLACIGFQVCVQANVMGEIPRQFWDAPVFALLGSALLLRVLDMNFPFWNNTLRVLCVPIAASVTVYGWNHFVTAAKCVI